MKDFFLHKNLNSQSIKEWNLAGCSTKVFQISLLLDCRNQSIEVQALSASMGHPSVKSNHNPPLSRTLLKGLELLRGRRRPESHSVRGLQGRKPGITVSPTPPRLRTRVPRTDRRQARAWPHLRKNAQRRSRRAGSRSRTDTSYLFPKTPAPGPARLLNWGGGWGCLRLHSAPRPPSCAPHRLHRKRTSLILSLREARSGNVPPHVRCRDATSAYVTAERKPRAGGGESTLPGAALPG